MVALPTAFVVFRLRGPYFAIGTWVVAEVFRLLLAQFKSRGGGTGTSLPKAATNESFAVVQVAEWLGLRSAAARDIVAYWLALALAVFTILLIYRVLRSRAGLALSAIRDSEAAASSVGVDAMRTKLWVYVLCAFGTGMTGALIYLQTARISPDAAFSVLDWTAMVIFIVVIGGVGSIEGPIVGVIVFFVMQDQLAAFGPWYLMLLGALAIVVMLFFRKGLWGTFADKYDLHLFPVRRRFELVGDIAPSGGKNDRNGSIVVGAGRVERGGAVVDLRRPQRLVTKYRWLSDTPRAHITNQRALEVMRDLGVEEDAKLYGTRTSI